MTSYYVNPAALNLSEPWCSPEHPNGNCSPSSGMAKPMTTEALTAFKFLQDQLNRVAHAKGWSKTPVDGRIGSSTVSLYNKAAGAKGFTPARDHNHLAAGSWSGSAGRWVNEFASSIGAPAVVKPPVWPPSVPSKPAPGGGMPIDPPAVGLVGQVSALGPLGLVVIVGGGFVAFKLLRGRKGKPMRAARASRKRHYARARRRRR